jgi:uncharacterized paraquat-inducible protein A
VTLSIQPDRAWEDLQRRMGETPQIQVCQACSVIPKKTRRGCNRCKSASTKYWVKGLNTYKVQICRSTLSLHAGAYESLRSGLSK